MKLTERVIAAINNDVKPESGEDTLKEAIAKKLKVTVRSVERLTYGNPARNLEPNADNSDLTKMAVLRLIMKRLGCKQEDVLTK